eukprot:scaffold161645_cov59-Attheya_sp.AAC.4
MTNGQADRVVCCHIVRPRNNLCAIVGDLLRSDIRVAHDTDGSRHLEIRIGDSAKWIGLRNYIVGNAFGPLDVPHSWGEEQSATEPYSSGSKCTCSSFEGSSSFAWVGRADRLLMRVLKPSSAWHTSPSTGI